MSADGKDFTNRDRLLSLLGESTDRGVEVWWGKERELVGTLVGPGEVSVWKVVACISGSVDTNNDIRESIGIEEAVNKGSLGGVCVATKEALHSSLADVAESDRLVLTSILQVPCCDCLGKIC